MNALTQTQAQVQAPESTQSTPRNAYAHSRRANRRMRLSMVGVLRSETIKLWSLNSTKVILAVSIILMVAMAALSAWSLTFMASVDLNTGQQLDEPQPVAEADLWAVLASSGSAAGLAIGILGVMTLTTEYTTSAIQSSLTATPRRGMFFVAKSVVVACFSLIAGILGVLAAWGVMAAMSSGLDLTPLEGDQWRILPVVFIGFPITMALSSLLGLGLGGLTRSTVGGICSLLGLFMMLSTILGMTSMMVSRFAWLGTLASLTPDSAMGTFLSAGIENAMTSASATVGGADYWSPNWWQAGLIFLAWVVVCWVGGLIVTEKADVK